MCYLIAKDTKKHGCFAIKTTHGKHLVQMKKRIERCCGAERCTACYNK